MPAHGHLLSMPELHQSSGLCYMVVSLSFELACTVHSRSMALSMTVDMHVTCDVFSQDLRYMALSDLERKLEGGKQALDWTNDTPFMTAVLESLQDASSDIAAMGVKWWAPHAFCNPEISIVLNLQAMQSLGHACRLQMQTSFSLRRSREQLRILGDFAVWGSWLQQTQIQRLITWPKIWGRGCWSARRMAIQIL